MKLTSEQALKLSKKLEYSFKKGNPDKVSKLVGTNDVELEDSEIKYFYSKLESRFKKSEDPLRLLLAEHISQLTQ